MKYGLEVNSELVPKRKIIRENKFLQNPESFLYLREEKGIELPKNKIVVIVGSSSEWERDLENFNKLDLEHDMIGVNKSGIEVENIEHWVSLHPEMIKEKFNIERKKKGWREVKTHSYIRTLTRRLDIDVEKYVDYSWDIPIIRGSSGLFALSLSYVLGYENAVVVGMSLEGSYRSYLNNWIGWYAAFKGFAFSMSGLTMELMGSPTKESLNYAGAKKFI